MIGMCCKCGLALIRRVTSYPSSPGSWISIRMRSGRSRSAAASALLAGHRLDQFVAAGRQQVAHDPAIVLLVLDHQDALAHVLPPCSFGSHRNAEEEVEPFPTVDSTQMRPPCISTMRLAIASPRPVPPLVLRGRAVAPAGTPRRSSAAPPPGFPGPVSATETTNIPSGAATRTATSPASVNLIALPTRFNSTCVMRRSSPWPTGRSGATSTVSCKLLLGSQRPDASDHRLDHVVEGVVAQRKRELSGLDLGQVEHVVDEAEQMASALLHALEHLADLRRAPRRRSDRRSARCSRGSH